jgi:hypothetical protein
MVGDPANELHGFASTSPCRPTLNLRPASLSTPKTIPANDNNVETGRIDTDLNLASGEWAVGQKAAVEDATVRQGRGIIAWPPIGICVFVVGNLKFYRFSATLIYETAISESVCRENQRQSGGSSQGRETNFSCNLIAAQSNEGVCNGKRQPWRTNCHSH